MPPQVPLVRERMAQYVLAIPGMTDEACVMTSIVLEVLPEDAAATALALPTVTALSVEERLHHHIGRRVVVAIPFSPARDRLTTWIPHGGQCHSLPHKCPVYFHPSVPLNLVSGVRLSTGVLERRERDGKLVVAWDTVVSDNGLVFAIDYKHSRRILDDTDDCVIDTDSLPPMMLLPEDSPHPERHRESIEYYSSDATDLSDAEGGSTAIVLRDSRAMRLHRRRLARMQFGETKCSQPLHPSPQPQKPSHVPVCSPGTPGAYAFATILRGY